MHEPCLSLNIQLLWQAVLQKYRKALLPMSLLRQNADDCFFYIWNELHSMGLCHQKVFYEHLDAFVKYVS
jgi:hypothetical protein